MKKITITLELPEKYEQWLCQEADRRNTSVEQIIWEAIYAFEYRSRLPRTLRAAGAGSSGETHISERIEELLAEEWGKSID